MAQDLAHKRPWLLASLLAGLSFPATWLFLPLEGSLYALIWKMAAVGFLVPFALRRHHEGEFALLALDRAFHGRRGVVIRRWSSGGDCDLFPPSPRGRGFQPKVFGFMPVFANACYRLLYAGQQRGGPSSRRLQRHFGCDGRDGVEQ